VRERVARRSEREVERVAARLLASRLHACRLGAPTHCGCGGWPRWSAGEVRPHAEPRTSQEQLAALVVATST
jgi:hypothetical protein